MWGTRGGGGRSIHIDSDVRPPPRTPPPPSGHFFAFAVLNNSRFWKKNRRNVTTRTISPPWTFETSPDEAFARIKGVLASDDAYVVTEVDDSARYVRAYARRITADADEVEFLVRADDGVVLFRSTARRNGSVSDFGANRKRIDDIRRRGAVFGLMGDGLTADSYNGGGEVNRNNGPLGQLKAFYGLQSGQGFEKLFEEEDE